MTTQTQAYPKQNRYDRAKTLGKTGYTIASSIYVQNLFHITKPDGTKYIVDAVRRTCSCPATVPDCAHLIFVDRCIAYAAHLDRKASYEAHKAAYTASLMIDARNAERAIAEAHRAEKWDAHDSAVADVMVLVAEICRVSGREWDDVRQEVAR